MSEEAHLPHRRASIAGNGHQSHSRKARAYAINTSSSTLRAIQTRSTLPWPHHGPPKSTSWHTSLTSRLPDGLSRACYPATVRARPHTSHLATTCTRTHQVGPRSGRMRLHPVRRPQPEDGLGRVRRGEALGMIGTTDQMDSTARLRLPAVSLRARRRNAGAWTPSLSLDGRRPRGQRCRFHEDLHRGA